MIESAGGMLPFLCHVFLIFFGGFFGISFAFNKNFVKNSIGYPSTDAMYMGRPLGFLMIGVVLMLIATLFQIGGFKSPNEVIGILFIFTILAFCFNIATTLKILESFDGNDWPIKHAIRPLIPMVVILIRYFSL
tara:strand:+ start:23086 stop:23487 length:402 start_codon:yes stop_codon:yes gene_type:complete